MRQKASNEVTLVFPSRSSNEGFARSAVACFAAQLDPTLNELEDIKTSVSEAVTNCIVHAYAGMERGDVRMECAADGSTLHITISDSGRGIADVARAVEPFFTTLEEEERSGMGFTIMQTFMTAFSVESRPGEGTAVTMTKRFGAPARGEERRTASGGCTDRNEGAAPAGC